MEAGEFNPKEIMLPQTGTEKIFSLLRSKSVTKELLERLREMNTNLILQGETQINISLDDVKKYIDREVAFVAKYYPPDARYSKDIENDRQRTTKMKKLFETANFLPLVKIMMDLATKHWNIADRLDETAKEWSPEDLASLAEGREENLKREAEANRIERETGIRQEHGMPPELLEIGGNRDRRESGLFLCYAVVLARAIK